MQLNISPIKFNNITSYFNNKNAINTIKYNSSLSCDTFQKNTVSFGSDEIKLKDAMPVANGTIFDKKLNKPVDVTVLKINKNENETTYRFVSKNRKKEYGYVDLTLCKRIKDFEYVYFGSDTCLLQDYPQYGIKGPRVIVDFLQNNNDSRYSGIGKLADKITVKHCLDSGIKPVVISIADWDSHVAHYKRGKRYLPLVSGTKTYNYFMKKYGTADVNQLLEQLIKESEQIEEKVDISDWNPVPMYMPKELAQKYVKELKSEKK